MKMITSFDTITLSETGMRAFTDEYEIVRTDAGVTLSYYAGAWKYNESQSKEDCLAARAEKENEVYEQILKLLNECKVMSWDGFSESDPRALDGTIFSFIAIVNDGIKINATGSNAYPKNYDRFKDTIRGMIYEQ